MTTFSILGELLLEIILHSHHMKLELNEFESKRNMKG